MHIPSNYVVATDPRSRPKCIQVRLVRSSHMRGLDVLQAHIVVFHGFAFAMQHIFHASKNFSFTHHAMLGGRATRITHVHADCLSGSV
jgi:hypothetical protein